MFIRINFITNQQICVLIHFFENNSYCNLGFCSFVWLFNLMNFSNMLLKILLLEKPLSQILLSCDFLFSWPESTCFLGSHFCENFDSKLDTWMFLNCMKLSFCSDLIHFFRTILLQFGLLHFCVIVQSHEILQHVFLKRVYWKDFYHKSNECVFWFTFLRTTLIAT